MEQRERYEALYHATTQHLLVRDFQAAEESVLSLLNSRPRDNDGEVEKQLVGYTETFEDRLRTWTRSSDETIQAYKLFAFVSTSKYTEGLEVGSAVVPPDTSGLKNVFDQVVENYHTDAVQTVSSSSTSAGSTPETRLVHLHPSILQTILLSLLKINSTWPSPYSEGLSTRERTDHPLYIARMMVERWLAGLEEETIKSLSFPKKFISREKNRQRERIQGNTRNGLAESFHSEAGNPQRPDNDEDHDWAWYVISGRMVDMNKSYRAVLRTYVLEILPRFGDWELAREMILAGLFPRVEEQEVSCWRPKG
jgi:hypothetical protein